MGFRQWWNFPVFSYLTSDQTILLDLDIIIGSRIGLFWRQFDNLTTDTLLPLPSLSSLPCDKFCSCIDLLHLERTCTFGWNIENATTSPGQFLPAFRVNKRLGTADQRLLSSMWYFHSMNIPAFYQCCGWLVPLGCETTVSRSTAGTTGTLRVGKLSRRVGRCGELRRTWS